MKNIYEKSKEYLDDFDDLKDYSEISAKLEEICLCLLEKKNINKQIKVVFEDNKAFGNFGTEYPDKISFNKLRCDTINILKIDCFCENHIKKIYDFYNHYDSSKNNNKFEECLYNFMKKYIGIGYQEYFHQMGSYKTIKYELLETLFHETQHVIQQDFNERYINNNQLSISKDIILVFTMQFNTMYQNLIDNNIQFDYLRENYYFPIEFDARYVALTMIEDLRKEYFASDKLFIQSILNNNILPKDVSFKELSEKIYNDFENIYKIYNRNLDTNYDKIFSIVNNHKDEIITQLINRYEEMNKIYKNLKIELDKK